MGFPRQAGAWADIRAVELGVLDVTLTGLLGWGVL